MWKPVIYPKPPKDTIVRKCPDCGRLVDKDGDTIEQSYCSECPNYSQNEPECKTCGYFPWQEKYYFPCDQSC